MFTVGQYKEGPWVFSVTENLSMGPNKRAVKLQPQVCVQHLSSHKEKKMRQERKAQGILSDTQEKTSLRCVNLLNSLVN